ncbi:MAG: glutathione S-transferase N-terminal domain-containing protein [Minwuia sp.]|uniref:glutathione S-transferase N-terminal domain-containing protein n=1 Tax=Minwuia sp. TaxID=2493630 RepID=UPI003A865743
MMRLISATPSPYARKVRIALAEKDIPFELVTEVPWNADARTPDYNPLGKLPVLILDSGETVYESDYILEWLEFHHPEPSMLPADPLERLFARKLEVLADGVCDAFVLWFFETFRPEDHRSAAWMERQHRKITGGLAEIDRLLPADREWCAGGRFGLGDIAVGTLLDYLTTRMPDLDWRCRHPGLADRLERLLERPSFRDTRPAPQKIDASVV